MIPFLIAAFLLYFPYVWCHIRKEPLSEYGLVWTLTPEALRECLLLATLTLVPLTPIYLGRFPGPVEKRLMHGPRGVQKPVLAGGGGNDKLAAPCLLIAGRERALAQKIQLILVEAALQAE